MATLTLNETRRMHWRAIQKYQRKLSWEVRVALGRTRPVAPFARAKVTIERHTSGTPDRDNLVGGMKDLIDCLLVPQVQKTKDPLKPQVLHAFGLSLVADDNPACLTLEAISVRIARTAPAKTIVTIEEMG